jgi:hypothetical protein
MKDERAWWFMEYRLRNGSDVLMRILYDVAELPPPLPNALSVTESTTTAVLRKQSKWMMTQLLLSISILTLRIP